MYDLYPVDNRYSLHGHEFESSTAIEDDAQGDLPRSKTGPVAGILSPAGRIVLGRVGTLGIVFLAFLCGSLRANTARDVIGVTREEIHQKFAGVIWRNLSGPWAEERLSRLSAHEMADLAIVYQRNTGDAMQLESLLRVYAPKEAVRYHSAVLAAYRAQFVATRFIKVALPEVDMSVQDIYLEFRTAPMGSMSPGAALFETSVYVMRNLAIAWGVGYTIGTGIHWAIETYDPALDDKIGGTMDTLLTNIANATTELNAGRFEYYLGLDSYDFGPASIIGGGDWGSCDPRMDFLAY